MKTILVPTDFAAEAKLALQAASNLAIRFKATLIVLHVIEGAGEGSFNVEGESAGSSSWENRLFNLKMIQAARKQMARVEADLTKSGVKFRTMLRMGDAFHGINALIIEQKTDLVVMGTRGTSGAEEVLIGSNTEKVVRRSGCPVLALSQKTSGEFKNIVWATSLKDEDMLMPSILREMIDEFNATVHLVRVNTPGLFINDTIALNKLNSLGKTMKLKKFTANTFSDFTYEEGILNYAESLKADLIYMVTAGRTGLAHLINGSVAEGVVNHSRRPVLTSVLPRKKHSD